MKTHHINKEKQTRVAVYLKNRVSGFTNKQKTFALVLEKLNIFKATFKPEPETKA